ncbi:MAG: hypothetical protein Q8Q40_14305, partial [Methylococcaceae bacterium]|nr:hypothetical protein [Methylococcaceae bacterium]
MSTYGLLAVPLRAIPEDNVSARRGIREFWLRNPKEMTFIDTQESLVSLSRQFILMPVLAPTGELLSFASPKESIQRKGDPDSANFLRFSL